MKGVGSNELEIYFVRVVGGDEVEGKEGDCEYCYELVYVGVLVWGEDFLLLDWIVG